MVSKFAGIPLEGSGTRPLDADLYGPEQSGMDSENMSATGNLNIGKVLDYDAVHSPGTFGDYLSPEQSGIAGNGNGPSGPAEIIALQEGDNVNNTFETTNAAPNFAADEPTQSQQSNDTNTQTTQVEQNGGNSFSSTSSQSSSSTSSNTTNNNEEGSGGGGGGNNTQNSYNTTTNTNNVNQNYTERYTTEYNGNVYNYYEGNQVVRFGDFNMDIDLSSTVESTGDVVNTLVDNSVDSIISLTNETVVGGVENTLSILSDIAVDPVINILNGDITDVAGDEINTVTGAVFNISAATGDTLTEIIGGSVLDSFSVLGDTIETTVGDVTVNVSDIVENNFNNMVEAIADISVDVTQEINNAIQTIIEFGGGQPGTLPLPDPLPLPDTSPLLDANASVLTPEAFDKADESSLIGADVAVLSATDNPNAGGNGLLDADATLFSAPEDGVSLSANTDMFVQDVLPGLDLPPVEADVPLGTSGDEGVPIVSDSGLIDTVMEAVEPVIPDLLQDTVVFDTFTGGDSVFGAVDAGVLFSSGSIILGGDSSSSGDGLLSLVGSSEGMEALAPINFLGF